MNNEEFFRHMKEQYEATIAPFKKIIEEHEEAARQMRDTIVSAVGPAIDYEKIFSGDLFAKSLAAALGPIHDWEKILGTDVIATSIQTMLGPAVDFGKICELPDSANRYESFRSAQEKAQRETAERARESFDLMRELDQNARESAERFAARIAEEVAKKLLEPEPAEPVPPKPRIGFGGPEK